MRAALSSILERLHGRGCECAAPSFTRNAAAPPAACSGGIGRMKKGKAGVKKGKTSGEKRKAPPSPTADSALWFARKIKGLRRVRKTPGEKGIKRESEEIFAGAVGPLGSEYRRAAIRLGGSGMLTDFRADVHPHVDRC